MKYKYVTVTYDPRSKKAGVEESESDNRGKKKKEITDEDFLRIVKKNMKKYKKDLEYLEDR